MSLIVHPTIIKMHLFKNYESGVFSFRIRKMYVYWGTHVFQCLLLDALAEYGLTHLIKSCTREEYSVARKVMNTMNGILKMLTATSNKVGGWKIKFLANVPTKK